MPIDAVNIAALVQVVLIDLALAGDNAVAVGVAASALPPAKRAKVIFWGVIGALALRIGFALVTVQLLAVHGVLLVGGLLLFWVAYRMWSDLKRHEERHDAQQAEGAVSFGRALMSIIIADVSMSLDNVLAVSGVARSTPVVLAIGLVLSVVLMAAAAGLIARIIERARWVAVVGIVIIIIAAVQMIWEDLSAFFPDVIPPAPKHAP